MKYVPVSKVLLMFMTLHEKCFNAFYLKFKKYIHINKLLMDSNIVKAQYKMQF